MTDEETIHVAEVSDGVGGEPDANPGAPVELPVVELLTGRGFVTGKSGSGKSNTASVLIENLLSNNFPCLIVDTDGEYYGLKEEFEILHAGADEECDIVVSPEHAEKIANLALEQNVPIILDVSGYLEQDTANELLLEVVKQLFAKEKKLKKPFLLVLEECHEYIPEGGGLDETGKMLIKVGKRGRKHGLGIVGISQRPADVKKDFITQCDWLCWHRLTWDNDTKVVSRILGSEYADEIEDMDAGEAFMMTDWDESIRRIQFHRKQTFDAGATPGLEDFERPELKSVSGDLVSELESISEEQARHESELADLNQELEKKKRRIKDLERDLEEARDMKGMADKFAQALLQKAEAPYRGGSGRNLNRQESQAGLDDYDEPETDERRANESSTADPAVESDAAEPPVAEPDADGLESAAPRMPPEKSNGDADIDGQSAGGDLESDSASGVEPTSESDVEPATPSDAEPASPSDVHPVSRSDVVTESAMQFAAEVQLGTREAVIEELRGRVDRLPEMSTEMLREYRLRGESDPVAVHIAVGGNGDSGLAYSRHRPIRVEGLIRHAGRDRYAYAIPDLVREAYADRLDEEEVDEMVAAVEEVFVRSDEADRSDGDASDDTEASETVPRDDPNAEGDSNAGDDPEAPNDPDGSDDPDPIEESSSTNVDNPGLNEAARRLASGKRLPNRSPSDVLSDLNGEYDSVEELAEAVAAASRTVQSGTGAADEAETDD